MRFFLMFFRFVEDLFRSRALLWDLTKRDFRQRYLGSYLGILWAFIQPAVTVFIFWFVFQVGFKSMPVENCPFVLWLVCGMFPWFFFSDGVSAGTNAILSNSYLVKKVVFRVSLLPVIQLLSALIVHVFFVAVLFLMFGLYGFTLSVYNLQVFYLSFALFCLTFGVVLITSSLVVFLKDVGPLVAMCLQFLFWGTPIFWSLHILPAQFQWIFALNPLYYIIEGYRISFIAHQGVWTMGYLNVTFWVTTALVMLAGAVMFKKLRPHFADVL